MQVTQILTEGEGEGARAVGVRLADGREFAARAVVSNATRWDTFEHLLPPEGMPQAERLFRRAHSPSAPLHAVSLRSLPVRAAYATHARH